MRFGMSMLCMCVCLLPYDCVHVLVFACPYAFAWLARCGICSRMNLR